jgi:hypothetical protein
MPTIKCKFCKKTFDCEGSRVKCDGKYYVQEFTECECLTCYVNRLVGYSNDKITFIKNIKEAIEFCHPSRSIKEVDEYLDMLRVTLEL